MDKLFNISAYTPDDFKQFFADPRTRANYLAWAPLLLVAEDWHAGKLRPEKDPFNIEWTECEDEDEDEDDESFEEEDEE